MAPFKLKFSKLSKSSSSSRSSSVEEPSAEEEIGGNAATSSIHGTGSTPNAIMGSDLVPNSPPPSYEYVLEETKQGRTSVPPSGGTSPPPNRPPEIIHKSSKELYRAVAKQFGITCKMSDHCRCLDCQSHYFECEFDHNEHQKTDGGLGAGTPMFISEVMHGTACTIL